jgi:predicted dehydrogenase
MSRSPDGTSGTTQGTAPGPGAAPGTGQVQDTTRLRFGVVGLSSDHVWKMGDGLAAQSRVELVAAADDDAGLRRRAAERWGLDRSYASHRPLLEAAAVDAILVCCDNAAKAEVAEEAAGRGVHVYMDKPMGASLGQARRIHAAVSAAGVRLMIAYHHTFNPFYDDLSRLLRDGALGTVYLARGAVGHAGPRETGCSDEFCAWLFDGRRNGGGSFADEGCYILAEFIDRLGRIVEVSAFTAHIGHRSYLPPDVEDNAVAILRFGSGALGLIDAKWGQAGPSPVLTSYHGLDGTLSILPDRAELAMRLPAEPGPGWEPTGLSAGIGSWRRNQPRPPDAGWDGREQRAFLTGLASGRPVEGPAGPAVALHVQEVIDAVYTSARTGRAVRVGE